VNRGKSSARLKRTLRIPKLLTEKSDKLFIEHWYVHHEISRLAYSLRH